MGPPPSDALDEGWLLGALDLALTPNAPTGTLAFRIGAEEASLVDGTAVHGIADGYDVLVEADAIDFYHLVVNRDSEGVRIEGRAVLERLLDAFSPVSPEPLPA